MSSAVFLELAALLTLQDDLFFFQKLLFGIITGSIGALADLYFLIKHLDQN